MAAAATELSLECTECWLHQMPNGGGRCQLRSCWNGLSSFEWIKGTGKQREMAKKVGQCWKETAGMAALSTAHTARGKNNNVDSSVGESILRANEYSRTLNVVWSLMWLGPQSNAISKRKLRKFSIKSSLACRTLEFILEVGCKFWDLLLPPLKLWKNLRNKN